MDKLLTPIDATESILSKLHTLNIKTYWDLLIHIPLRYEDLTKIYPIRELKIGQQVLLEGTIIGHEIRNKQLIVKLDDGSGIINLIFFHYYPSYRSQYNNGRLIRAHGEIKADYYGNKSIIHPKIQTVQPEIKLPNTFNPIYSTTNGLRQATIIKLVETALLNHDLEEYLPDNILRQLELPHINQAIVTLHKLTALEINQDKHKKALKRLKLDELIAHQLIMYDAYKQKHANPSHKLKLSYQYIKPLLESLPFKLTNAQNKVWQEITTDLAASKQMNRLLQGDVGSGKTIIATLAMLVAVENNFQAAIMAPTEILAEQHYLKTSKLLKPLNINCVWLCGSLTAKQKRETYELITNGKAQIVIGTHAIFQKDVRFKNLAVIVIDEQHRFGVNQRLTLSSKGYNPHQLLMSATPIPRTLAMSYYADLDISVIDELPPNRTVTKTLLINNNRRNEVIQFVNTATEQSRQVYWVCPLIEESDKLELENAINTYNELTNLFKTTKVSLIHGKMKTNEKAEIMAQFGQNQIQVLVATTVIEVGVDVANASIMVIEHSERMGLSQLHQLRGRVGRGNTQSQCILLYQPNMGEIAKQRLKIIFETNDGFEIARQDLILRGPGELLGAKQSGLPMLKFANLEHDQALLIQAKQLAKQISELSPQNAQELTELWFHNKYHYSQA